MVDAHSRWGWPKQSYAALIVSDAALITSDAAPIVWAQLPPSGRSGFAIHGRVPPTRTRTLADMECQGFPSVARLDGFDCLDLMVKANGVSENQRRLQGQ